MQRQASGSIFSQKQVKKPSKSVIHLESSEWLRPKKMKHNTFYHKSLHEDTFFLQGFDMPEKWIADNRELSSSIIAEMSNTE